MVVTCSSLCGRREVCAVVAMLLGEKIDGSEVAGGKDGRHRNIEAVSVDVSSSLWEARFHTPKLTSAQGFSGLVCRGL